MKTLIGIQEEYVATVNAGIARWAHRKDGGHAGRIMRGARRRAEGELRRLGFTDSQVAAAIGDARDMAALLRLAGE